LRNDGRFTVDFILEERVEILMIGVVGHDDQEDEAGLGTRGDVWLHSRVIVELDTLGECLQKFVFVLSGPVLDKADVCVLNEDIKSLFDGHVVELLIDVARVLFISLQAEDGEVFKCLRLVHHGVEAVGVLEGSGGHHIAGVASHASFLLLSGVGCLLLEIRRFEDHRSLENRRLDGIGGQIYLKTPLLDLLGVGNHGVEVADGLDAVVGLLEKTLAHGGHDLFVLSHALGDAHEGAKFWRQVDVLALLFNFE